MQTLLIVESSQVLAGTLQAQLRDNYQVHTCADGHEALNALAQLRPEVMILDLSLPGLDGLSVLEQAAHVPPVILARCGGETLRVLAAKLQEETLPD